MSIYIQIISYLQNPYVVTVTDPAIAQDPAYVQATAAITLTPGVAAIAINPTATYKNILEYYEHISGTKIVVPRFTFCSNLPFSTGHVNTSLLYYTKLY